MFETLSDRLSGVFGSLTRQGALTDEDIATALREVRTALLEADVSLPVARDFVKQVADKAKRPGGDQVGHPRPAGRQDRPRRAHRHAPRRGRARRTSASTRRPRRS